MTTDCLRSSASGLVSAPVTRSHQLMGRFLLAGLLVLPMPGYAQRTDQDSSPHSEIELVSDVAAVEPGRAFTAAIRITLDPHWHTYWINGGDAGLPLEIRWDLPDGFVAGPLEWPVPERIPVPPLMSYGYEDEVVVLVGITPPADLAGDTRVILRGDADWLVCADVCIPASADVSLTLPVSVKGYEQDDRWASVIADARRRLPGRPDAWTVRAWTVDSAFVLELDPDPASALTAPYLFADDMSLVEHALPQGAVRTGDTWLVRIPRSRFAPDSITRIAGILVADAGAGRESTAWTIDAAVVVATVDVANRIERTFAGGSVVQTGGLASDAVDVGGTTVEPGAAAAGSGMGILLALVFAFAGGLILNLMPCVFPILSVKVMSFIESAGGGGSRRHAVLFTTGVVLSFWILAVALFLLRAAGAGLGWGFHLQSPTIVALLSLVMFSLALSMSGVFEFGAGLTRLGAVKSSRRDVDAVLTGGLAVLVAAPCTAPFMGAALGFALVQPPAAGLAVFTALGLGLAAPYSVLAATPALIRRLPRPGRWMETLKQSLAFPLYATVVWLVWVFGRQAGLNASAVLLFALTLAGFAAWLAGRTAVGRTTVARAAVWTVAALSLTVSVWSARSLAAESPENIPSNPAGDVAGWERFSPERVDALRGEGRIVFVNFTAAWCLSCQVNDRVALRSVSVRERFAAADVALLEADWTSRDAEIADVLQSFGRSGVPLYVVYSPEPDRAPEILPAILTPGIVRDAIDRAEADVPATD